MDNQIRRVRRSILVLFVGGTIGAAFVLSLINPIVAQMPPDSVRLGLYNYLIFTPLLALLVAGGAYVYLRPITELGKYLQRRETPPPDLARRARILAFSAPIRFLYVPIGVTFVVATLSDILGALFVPGYYLAVHFPSSLLATLAATVVCLIISIISRRLLLPVLQATAELVERQDEGPRFAIRTRQLTTIVVLMMIATVFLGLLGYNMVVSTARQGLRYQYQMVGHTIIEGMSPYVTDDALIAYVESLDLDVDGFAFLLARDGTMLTRVPPAYADWDLQVETLYVGVQSFKDGELFLLPLPRQDGQWWLGFVYRIDPLLLPQVASALTVLGIFVVGMLALVFAINHQASKDLTRDLDYVTYRLVDLARGKRVGEERLSVVSLDEVGDLTLAFNALLDKVQVQQAQMEHEQKELLALQQVSAKIASILDIKQLLAELIASMEETFGYRNSAIMLLDDSGERLEVAARAAYLEAAGACNELLATEGIVGQVVRTGEPLTVPDVEYFKGYVAIDPETRSELAVPMLISGKVIGVLNVESHEFNAFTARDVRIASSLANQAAIAIHNADLYYEVEAQRQTATALAQLAWTLNYSLNLDEVLNMALQQLAKAITFDSAAIHLLEGRDLTIVACRGFQNPNNVIGRAFGPEDNNLGYLVMKDRRVRVVGDVQELAEWGTHRADVEGADTIRAWIGAPLVVQGKSIGLLSIDKHEPDFYNDSDIATVDAFASHIALAVHNARLYQTAQQRAAELAKMAHNIAIDRSKLDAILRNIADGLIVVDPASIILLVNPAFEELFERPAASLVGQLLTTALNQPELRHLISDAFQDTDSTFMAEIPMSDGRILKASSAAIVEEEQLIGVVSVMRDITHEKEIDRMKTEFISTVSHELRTPLTSVLGFAKLINRSFEKDVLPHIPKNLPETSRALQRICENLRIILVEGERLTQLINDVLDIAKLESGKAEWRDEPLDMAHMIDLAVRGIRDTATAKGLALRIHIADSLPMLYADPVRIRQLLDNLLTNAVKFTTTGEIEIKVGQVEAGEILRNWRAPQGGGLRVSIRDTGPGISPEDAERIFMRFQQLVGDTLTDKPKGTGLGLAICREIASHYGGAIWVDSEVDSGSVFHFVLPVTSLEVDQLPEAPLEMRPRTTGLLPPLEAMLQTVLIVDDEPHIRLLLTQELERVGYRILQAASGTEALVMARRHQPALILLDVMLPDISGFDVLRILKSDPATLGIPVLILSIVEDRRLGLALGANAYLMKPVDTEQLLTTVSLLLSHAPQSSSSVVAVQDRTALEAVTAALRGQGFEMVKGYDPRGALLSKRQALPDTHAWEDMLSDLEGAELVKVLRFQDAARMHTVVVFFGGDLVPGRNN